MTNDYKDKLLKYLTGNIQKGVKSSTPFYEESSKRENNEVIAGSGFYEIEIIDTLYCVNGNGEYNGKILVYGNGNTNAQQDQWNGFIYIFDSEFNVLKKFTTFESGIKLGTLEKLNIDEIGQVYGIDYWNSQHRLIMLNNISEKGNLPDYRCILRQSYFLQGSITGSYIVVDSSGVDSGILDIQKSKQSAIYFMCGLDSGRDLVYATSLQINVGAANEWIDYTSGAVYSGSTFLKSYTYFDIDDNISANLYFQEVDALSGKTQITRLSNSGTALSVVDVLVRDLESYVNIVQDVNLAIINRNKFYIGLGGVNGTSGSYRQALRVLFFEGGGINPIYSREEEIGNTYYYGTRVIFTIVNNQVFMVGCLPVDFDVSDTYFDIYVNLLNEDNVNYEYKLEDQAYGNAINNSDSFFYGVSNAFNVYNILVSFYPKIVDNTDFYTYSTKIIYRNGYNGEEVEDEDSLLPKQGLLFDSQDNLIFARDLYNNKVYNNRSISVLNIPNTFLNDVQIGSEELLSSTNALLVSNSEAIEKNVYEDLYINFNNQITMQNRNETNYIDNLEGAIRLNQSSNRLVDYNDAKATKIRITYDDDTTYITSAPSTITDNVCTYTIGVHVPSSKNILKIDFISNDENTIYQTLSNLNLEKNKYYLITQDVYVE